MADETPLQMLHEPERRAQTKSYMWLFRSGEDGAQPVIIYRYSPTRAGDYTAGFLDGFRGYLIDVIPKWKQLYYTQSAVQGVK